MKKISAFLLLVFTVCAGVAFAITGREIMEKTDALKKPESGISTMEMNIYRGGSLEEVKELRITGKKINGNQKSLTEFIKPTKIKFLSHENKGRDDDQWLKMTSGKPKRIASQDKGKPFVHSHIFYEDLSALDINDFDFTYKGDGQTLGAPCFIVDAVKKGSEKVYSKVTLYVRKSDYYVIKTDFYQNNKILKTMENFDIKIVNGIITAHRMVMSMADGSGKTEMKMKSVQYNVPVYDSLFNKETL